MDISNMDLNNDKERSRIFDLMKQHLMRSNFLSLKRLSNDLVEMAVLKNNKNLVYLSYLPYMLYKLLTQPHIVKNRDWPQNRRLLLEAIETVQHSELPEYVDRVSRFGENFQKVDFEVFRYLKNTIEKSKVKQASKLYERGFSVKKAISFTDADILEFQHYLHHSKDHDLIMFQEEIPSKLKMIEAVLK